MKRRYHLTSVLIACLAAGCISSVEANDFLLHVDTQKGALRILLMLKGDVGLERAHPIDPSLLKRLSLKAGVDLAWEGNSRTNGQILSLPIGITTEQAKKASEQLSLEPGVLWAEMEETSMFASRADTASPQDQIHGEKVSRFIIKLKDDDLSQNLNPVLLEKLESAGGVKLTVTSRTTFARILTLAVPLTVDEAKIVANSFESLQEVTYADPDRRVYLYSPADITPNDALFWRNWHLQGPYALPGGSTNGYLGSANVQAAWQLTEGKPSGGVAVVDTGILFDHPDLKRSLGRQTKKRGWDMVTDITRARDGNSRDPDAQDEGNWIDKGTICFEDESTTNSNWHGSHVAGTIAATTNNNIGVSGINWKSKLVPIRVLAACPNETMTDLVDGIVWATGKSGVPGTSANKIPIQVQNISLGIPMDCPSSYQEAIDLSLSKGISVVVSAGNSQSDVKGSAPANCRGVISVASVSPFGDKAYYSNFGAGITIAAPGGQQRWSVYDKEGVKIGNTILKEWGIWSTVSNSLTGPNLGEMTYMPYQGTSMAAPVVTGVISLMASVDRNHKLTPAVVSKILRDTARPFPQAVPVFTALKTNPDTGDIEQYTWENTKPSECTTSLAGQCGPGIVDARAAIQAVLELQKGH